MSNSLYQASLACHCFCRHQSSSGSFCDCVLEYIKKITTRKGNIDVGEALWRFAKSVRLQRSLEYMCRMLVLYSFVITENSQVISWKLSAYWRNMYKRCYESKLFISRKLSKIQTANIGLSRQDCFCHIDTKHIRVRRKFYHISVDAIWSAYMARPNFSSHWT